MESVLGRIKVLLEMGDKVLATRRPPSPNVIAEDFVDTSLFTEWKASSMSFISRVFGEDHIHFRNYKDVCMGSFYSHALKGQAVLKAIKADIDGGYLGTLENLVAADIFTDFIEISEYLCKEGFKDPAASLVGAVLEDGLKSICKKNGIKVRNREDIGSLNTKLSEANIYNRIIQKQVQVWNEIRNNADHGDFKEYTQDLVTGMIAGVRDFLAKYL